MTPPRILTIAIAAAVLSAGCHSSSNVPPPQPVEPSGPREIDPEAKKHALEQYIKAARAYREGKREDAEQFLLAATSLDPNLIMARSVLGDLYRETQQYEKAAQHYEALTALDPKTSDNFYRLGVAYHLLKELERAAGAYSTAIELSPEDWKSQMNLGLVQSVLGDHENAVKHARESVRINPQSAVAYANLGAVLDGAGKLAEAANAYRKALEMDPERVATYLNLTSNLMNQKKPADAAVVMDALIRRQDAPPYRRRYGDVLAAAGRFTDAAKQYQAAIDKNPDYLIALNGLGDAYIAQYRKTLQLDDSLRIRALQSWAKSLEKSRNQPDVEEKIKRWRR